MNYTLAVDALIWPIIVLAILLLYRGKISSIVEDLAIRAKAFKFAGFSLKLAQAKPFVPEWSGVPNALDLRHKATAIQVNDSTRRTFLTTLTDEGTGDYAEIDLGTGKEWLSSRLFIWAIVFARMKSIECFVFVEASRAVRKRFVGWAEPEKIRWAFAQRYPWLERAYADAYATVTSQRNAVVVSRHGRLGYPHAPGDPSAAVELLKEFLQRVQQLPVPAPRPAEPEERVIVDTVTNTQEHARWIDAEELALVLGVDCNTVAVQSSDLRSKSTEKQLRSFLSMPARFVAVVADDGRFEYLVRREILVEEVAKTIAL